MELSLPEMGKQSGEETWVHYWPCFVESDVYSSHPSGDVESASGHRRLSFQGQSRPGIVFGCHWWVECTSRRVAG